MPTFVIDARFLLRNTTETFWGTPLIVVNGSDNTFCYGFMRDLLRLRNLLHINAGAIALGRDAWSLAPQKEVRTVVEFCRFSARPETATGGSPRSILICLLMMGWSNCAVAFEASR